jgi:alkanesulfonate monooxygenase SsuD/methylene tetrahydromethanopterin reductase-like flavin-dependent oxidoreductase (luciferase family)
VPAWLVESEKLLRNSVYGGRDLGGEVMQLSVASGRLPWGPNFAVRTKEQRCFRYDPLLGHAPRQRRRGEELDVLERIFSSGATGYWIPDASVEHCSDAGQQTLRYVGDYFATIGETQSALATGPQGKYWFGVPRWIWRRLIEGWLCYRFHRLIFSRPSVWMCHLRDYAYARGAIRFYVKPYMFGRHE